MDKSDNITVDEKLRLINGPYNWIDFGSFERVETSKYQYKFKVGDRVRAINHGYGTSGSGEETTIVELGAYKKGPGYRVDNPKIGNSRNGSYNYMCGEKSFELITISEKESASISMSIPMLLSELKHGDVVRVLDTPNVRYWSKELGGKPIGQLLTIDQHDLDGIYNSRYICPEGNKYLTNFKDGDFTLHARQYKEQMKEEPMKEELKGSYKFHVGQKVKIVKSGWGVSDTHMNDIVTITKLGKYSITSNVNGYSVTPLIGNCANRAYNGMIAECSFQAYDEKIEKPQQKKTVCIFDLEEGDIVEVIDCPEIRRWSKDDSVVGKQFVIKKEDIEKIDKLQKHIFLENNKYRINFKGEYLTLISKASKYNTAFDPHQKTPLQIVDVVRVVANGNEHEAISKSKEDKYFQEPIKVVKNKTIKQLKLV